MQLQVLLYDLHPDQTITEEPRCFQGPPSRLCVCAEKNTSQRSRDFRETPEKPLFEQEHQQISFYEAK